MLINCTKMYGHAALIEQNPPTRIIEGAIWLPRSRYGEAKGLYEPSGRVVTESLTFRGFPEPHTPLGRLYTLETGADLPKISRDFHYIHLGHVNRHYGHFLIGAVARLWNLSAGNRSRLRLVFDEDYTVEDMFAVPHIRTLWDALGLKEENFVRFPHGAVFESIEVPGLAFEENSHIHRTYQDLMNWLGSVLVSTPVKQCPDRMIYFTKHHLQSGIRRIEQEEELTHHLAAHGVEIVPPESLTLVEQIRLWKEGGVFMGFSGSSLHTGIFHQKNRILSLCHTDEAPSNQVLIDKATNTRGLYLHDPELLENGHGIDGFWASVVCHNPRLLAQRIIQAAKTL